ncbi:MAG: Rhodopirellula transposase [Candidatus Accumulibacter vicinus]|uniref:Rhodopirellula transposase n=1 Tax=Candidatus Accumulibacter vicinus TaxID=2954382 RepID=A0A084XZH0_9PROT|nr:MAG: Rhodopirellula transposase [Candidatus Accumulibacter vicinus]
MSRQVVVNLIGNTTADTGLRIKAALDENAYTSGIKVSDEELPSLAIERDPFHGEWNYRLIPRSNDK